MDEFGVLVESIGFRAQGKSAPMAKLKPKPKSQFTAHKTASFQDSYSLPVDELDGIFRSNVNISKTRQPQNTIVDDDIFGGDVSGSSQYGGVDLDSVFSSSSNGNNLNSRKSGGFDAYDDLLGSNSKQASPVDDLLGGFGQDSRGKQEKKAPGFDDLIPGFGGASPSKDEVYSDTNISRESSGRPSRSSSPVIDDPFLVFESSANQSNASWTFDGPSDQNTRKGSFHSSIDDLDDFVMGGARNGSKVDSQRNIAKKPNSGRSSNVIDDLDDFVMGGARSSSKVDDQRNTAKKPSSGRSSNVIDDLDDFIVGGARSGSEVDEQGYTAKKPSSGRSSNVFESANFVDDIFGGQQNNASRPRSMSQTSLFGEFVDDAKEPEVKQTSSWSSSSTKKAASVANVGNDFTSLFGDVTTSSGEFQEIDGEPEERRRARLDRHMRTNARMAKALSEKNQRDLQSQHEHEEKCRLAETLDYDIKRWATGKEGNLRALLSSLQQVLWAECGWRPVSLTDMITSDSVKKVYKKATLCVHPDKVQQKGASLQQKYIAEKVFDLLKEAWNKFSAEELR